MKKPLLSKIEITASLEVCQLEALNSFMLVETSFCHSRAPGNPGRKMEASSFWMPAFAGMT
jgi:hypothetical protein